MCNYTSSLQDAQCCALPRSGGGSVECVHSNQWSPAQWCRRRPRPISLCVPTIKHRASPPPHTYRQGDCAAASPLITRVPLSVDAHLAAVAAEIAITRDRDRELMAASCRRHGLVDQWRWMWMQTEKYVAAIRAAYAVETFHWKDIFGCFVV